MQELITRYILYQTVDTAKEKHADNRKLFNTRPTVIWAMFVFVTVVLLLRVDVTWGWWVIGVWFGVIFVIWGWLFIKAQSTRHHAQRLRKLKILFVVTIVLCVGVTTSFALTTHAHHNSRQFIGRGEITGTVRGINIHDEYTGRGGATLVNVTWNGESVRGRVRLNFNNIDESHIRNIEMGNIIQFNAVMSQIPISGFAVNNRIRYSASVNGNHYQNIYEGVPIRFVKDATDVRSTVMRGVSNFLNRHMTQQGAGVILSMLFGDRSSMDDDVMDSFSATGLAHVIAVSGLHVALLVGILSGIMSLFKISKKRQMFVIIAVLAFYVYLADFRYSILRTSIMFTTVMFGRLFLRRTELVSSVCFAAIIIMVIWPYAVLAWSFQLSFACLMGIALFARPVTRGLDKILPNPKSKQGQAAKKYLVRSAMLDIATMFTTAPLIISFFSHFPLIGLVANTVVLPLLVFSFQLGLVATLSWVLFPLLYLADWIIWFALQMATWMANISWAQFSIYGGTWVHFIYFAGLVFLSRFIFLKPKTRIALSATAFAIYGTILIIFNT